MPRASFLLIGADGLVGRHLSAALPQRDTVRTYRRNRGEETGRVLDITKADAVRATIGDVRPDVILLAAADAYVEHCERDPVATRRVNVEPARVIAECAKSDALLVVFSSEYVFDGTAGAYAEEDARRPLNEYGRQKVALEDIVLATGRGMVCRTSGVFGDDPQRKSFVCQLVDRLRAGDTFDVPSDQLITPTYGPSLARAVVKLAEQGRTGLFHIAGPEVLGRVEFALLVTDAFALDPGLLRPRPTTELGLIAKRPERAGLRTEKLRQELGGRLTAPRDALRELTI